MISQRTPISLDNKLTLLFVLILLAQAQEDNNTCINTTINTDYTKCNITF